MKKLINLTKVTVVLAIIYFATGVFFSVVSVPEPTPEQERIVVQEARRRLAQIEKEYFHYNSGVRR